MGAIFSFEDPEYYGRVVYDEPNLIKYEKPDVLTRNDYIKVLEDELNYIKKMDIVELTDLYMKKQDPRSIFRNNIKYDQVLDVIEFVMNRVKRNFEEDEFDVVDVVDDDYGYDL